MEGLGMVGWSWVGNLDWVSWLSWVVWLVVGLTLVSHISNVARVGISNVVGDNLGATVWKSNTVFTSGGIAISVLVLGKVGTRVVISNSITILIDSWAIIFWLMVSWLGWVVWSRFVDWGWVVWGWGRLVDNWSWVVDSSWLVNNWLVDNWSWVVDWGWLVDNWGWVVDWGWLMVSWGMDWDVLWGMDWDMGWSMNSSAVLLSGIWVMDVLWGSMGLAGHNSSIRSMGLVDGVAHSWSISVLDDLVVGLVSGSNGQKSRDSNKSLKCFRVELILTLLVSKFVLPSC